LRLAIIGAGLAVVAGGTVGVLANGSTTTTTETTANGGVFPGSFYARFSNGIPSSLSFFPLAVFLQNPAGGDVPTCTTGSASWYNTQACEFAYMGINTYIGFNSSGTDWPGTYGTDIANGQRDDFAAACAERQYVIAGGDPSSDTSANSVASVQSLLSAEPQCAKYFVGYLWTDEPPCGTSLYEAGDIPTEVANVEAEDPTREVLGANFGAWEPWYLYEPGISGCDSSEVAAERATQIGSNDEYALIDPWHQSQCLAAADVTAGTYPTSAGDCLWVYGMQAQIGTAMEKARSGGRAPYWEYVDTGTDALGLDLQGTHTTCDYTTNVCTPGNEVAATPVQVNSAAWGGIINGANGIEWFCDASNLSSTGTTPSGNTAYDGCAGGGSGGNPSNGDEEYLPANVRYVDSNITTFAPELNSDVTGICSMQNDTTLAVTTSCSNGVLSVSTSNTSEPIVARATTYACKTYLFVESDRANGETTGTYTITGTAGKTATLVYDSATRYDPTHSEQGYTFSVNGSGVFSDTLGTRVNPYQVKVYSIS
jgi:hypothetical protein